MQEEKIKWLICQHLDQNCTAEEEEELTQLLLGHPELATLLDLLSEEESLAAALRQWESFSPAHSRDRLRENIRQIEAPHIRRQTTRRWLAAAALILLLASAIIFYPPETDKVAKSIAPPPMHHDLLPGGNHAHLTLGDGHKVALDSISPGYIASQPGSRITKTDSCTILYTNINTDARKPEDGSYNTLTTPRGGQFSLTLPDHTKVYLNNSSEIRYPSSFGTTERTVELSGEAYFEISQDATRPFHVKINKNLTIHVLGTRFVIAAYAGDPKIYTTLIDGKLQVAAGAKTHTLSPRDQLIVTQNNDDSSHTELLHDTDTDEALAWKEGYFHFSHSHLRNILQQIGRWYDLDIDIAPAIPDYIYNGEIERHLPISSLIGFLAKEKLHLRIEDKKLIVTNE